MSIINRNNTEVLLERDFLKGISLGDNNAYKQLYDILFIPMSYVATSYVKSNAIAEELVQDTFMNLLEDRQYFKSIKHLKHYLYVILKNKCIDYIRKEKVRTRYEKDTLSETKLLEDSFWDKVLKEEVIAKLMEGINSLPPQCRKVMHFSLEGKRNSEIANIMQISVETVKDYKRTSKIKLKKIFKRDLLMLLILIKLPFF